MRRTYSLAEVAEALGIDAEMKDPETWLMRQIRAGRIRARKIGRHWHMTDADIDAALDVFASTPEPPAADRGLSLTPASLRRRAS
jgi:hypothetical protein